MRVVIAHLFTEYGHVEYQDLVGNFSKLSDMWDANQNFQELAKPAQEIQEFVNDGSQTIANEDIIDTIYTLIYNTGCFMKIVTNGTIGNVTKKLGELPGALSGGAA